MKTTSPYPITVQFWGIHPNPKRNQKIKIQNCRCWIGQRAIANAPYSRKELMVSASNDRNNPYMLRLDGSWSSSPSISISARKTLCSTWVALRSLGFSSPKAKLWSERPLFERILWRKSRKWNRIHEKEENTVVLNYWSSQKNTQQHRKTFCKNAQMSEDKDMKKFYGQPRNTIFGDNIRTTDLCIGLVTPWWKLVAAMYWHTQPNK